VAFRSLKPAALAAGAAIVGALLTFSTTPANAANPPYSGCPGWALCLYENGGGTGSKEIVTPPPAGGNTLIVRLLGNHFLNGDVVDNNTSSWINNSQCQIEFWDDPSGELHPSQVDFAPSWSWGTTSDYSFGTPEAYANDRISSLRFYCP
jgi:hypothetical protein